MVHFDSRQRFLPALFGFIGFMVDKSVGIPVVDTVFLRTMKQEKMTTSWLQDWTCGGARVTHSLILR